MSVVTDIVFVTDCRSTARRFQELFSEHYTRMQKGYIPQPVNSSGPRESGLTVFHLGVPYADSELMAALRKTVWPDGTTLVISEEHRAGIEVRVGEDYILESRPGF